MLARDDTLDQALLKAGSRSQHWLDLSGQVDARLGETVMTLGYPYLGTLGQGLTVTGGNVSALHGLQDDADRMMISAPVQPGNSDRPLLNSAGVVARVSDQYILKETGTLPQNMNFAVPNSTLTRFLTKAQVMFPRASGAQIAMDGGIPETVSAAVVAIECR